MMLNRRNLFKGVGAFVGAASAYTASEAGVLLPFDKIITGPVSHWNNYNLTTAFEGAVMSLTMDHDIQDDLFRSNISIKSVSEPITTAIDLDMDVLGSLPDMRMMGSTAYVQIFYRL